MTKYAVLLTGDEQARAKTERKLLNKEGGETPIEAFLRFIKEKFHDVRIAMIEGGKVVVDMADDAIQSFTNALRNLLRSEINIFIDVESVPYPA